MKTQKFESKEEALKTYQVSKVIEGVNVYTERSIAFGLVRNTPYKKHEGTLETFLSSDEICYFNRAGQETLFKGFDMYGNLLIHIT